MQIVDPNQAKPKKRQAKKEPMLTPVEYRAHYSHMQVSLKGQSAYYPRVKDPGATFAKHMGDAIRHNQKRGSDFAPGGSDDVRAVIFSEKHYSTPILGVKYKDDNDIMGIPRGTSEEDLKALLKEAKAQKEEASLATFAQRLQMLLGMLGEVEVINGDQDRFHSIRYGTKYKILKVKGHVLMLMED